MESRGEIRSLLRFYLHNFSTFLAMSELITNLIWITDITAVMLHCDSMNRSYTRFNTEL